MAEPRPGIRVADVLVVGVGGMIGTGVRFLVASMIPTQYGVPWGVLIVNCSGAFLLGLLTGLLSARTNTKGTAHRTHLFFGTGVLGGFTTYSALTSDMMSLFLDGAVFTALSYGIGTVVVGGCCSILGLIAGRRISVHRVRS